MPQSDLRLRPRKADGHKGTFGHLLVVAGSRGMVGAACLSTLAALRSGVGLVTLATAAGVQPVAAGRCISAMTVPLPETADGSVSDGARATVSPFIARANAVAIGPGLTTDAETATFVRALLREDLGLRPAVVDADALNALVRHLDDVPADAWARLVLTPHPGEFARLIGQPVAAIVADPDAAVAQFAESHPGVTLVLKLPRTRIIGGDDPSVHVNRSGHVGLATGGSGDVLTGMIGALLAQGYPPLDAARIGVFVHGRAGELCASRLGPMAMTSE
ncbi:MAG: NAD(P)H-hydrate dehydratase, partial [Planctomycetota bacterium]